MFFKYDTTWKSYEQLNGLLNGWSNNNATSYLLPSYCWVIVLLEWLTDATEEAKWMVSGDDKKCSSLLFILGPGPGQQLKIELMNQYFCNISIVGVRINRYSVINHHLTTCSFTHVYYQRHFLSTLVVLLHVDYWNKSSLNSNMFARELKPQSVNYNMISRPTFQDFTSTNSYVLGNLIFPKDSWTQQLNNELSYSFWN